LSWLKNDGIDYYEKETVNGLSGQLFCRQSSKLIVAMLLDECRKASVEIKLNCKIESVLHPSASWSTKQKHGLDHKKFDSNRRDSGHGKLTGFRIGTSLGHFVTEKLVVATGGLSIPSLGGSGLGYELARVFGLRVNTRSAGLVPFTFTDAMHSVCKRLAGISTQVVIFNDRQSFREVVLFTHRGLSGPAVLQFSSYWRPGETMAINLLPDDKTGRLLKGWKQSHPKSVLRSQLEKRLPRKLVLELQQMWWPRLAETMLAEWPDARLEAVGQELEAWVLKPAATEGYRSAEVTLGGIDTRDLSSKTMESNIPGLFFVGELLDVTGHLGGFNFQWAWSSGYVAGQAI